MRVLPIGVVVGQMKSAVDVKRIRSYCNPPSETVLDVLKERAHVVRLAMTEHPHWLSAFGLRRNRNIESAKKITSFK